METKRTEKGNLLNLAIGLIAIVQFGIGIMSELQESIPLSQTAATIFAYLPGVFILALLLGGITVFAGINITKYHRWAKRLCEVLLLVFGFFIIGFAIILIVVIPSFPQPAGSWFKIMAGLCILPFLIPIYFCLRWLRSKQVTAVFDRN